MLSPKLPAFVGIFLFALLCMTPAAAAQESSGPSTEKPQVHYNYLNVCTPGDAEKHEIASALERVPVQPKYSADFELTRGHTSLADAPSARYVRLRRELSPDASISNGFSNVQYSISTDAAHTMETLVFKVRDPKDLLLVSIEDAVSSTATPPGAVLTVDTPASRIKIERFGKSSLVLARCDSPDAKDAQLEYEPLFTKASKLLAGYRKNLGLRGMFRADLSWVSSAPREKTKPIEIHPDARPVSPAADGKPQ